MRRRQQWDASSLPAQRAPRRCSASALPTGRGCGCAHTRPARSVHVPRLGAGQGGAYYHEAGPARDLSQSDGTSSSAEVPGPSPMVRNLRGRHHPPPCAEGPHCSGARGGPGAWVANAAGPPWTATEAASAMPPYTPGSAVQPDRPPRCLPWCARDLPEGTGHGGNTPTVRAGARVEPGRPRQDTAPPTGGRRQRRTGRPSPPSCVQRAPQRLPALLTKADCSPITGTLQHTPALPTDKHRGQRPLSLAPRLSSPPASAPKMHPHVPPRHRRGPHARAQTEAPAGGGPPLPVRPLRLPAAPRTGSPSSQGADP